MFIEQAIFTSVRRGHNAGYQLAAISPGVSHQQRRELSLWGPGHDSLYPARQQARAISFWQLESGPYCIGHTVPAGAEYSGRGGARIYTQFFLLARADLARFAGNPFRVVEALNAAGRIQTINPLPDQLAPLPLVGRASPVHEANLQRVNEQLGAHKLATLLQAVLASPALGVTSPLPMDRVLGAMLDLLPPAHRPAISLTTGLKVSAGRPFRVHMLPDNESQKKLAVRQLGMTPISLLDAPPVSFAPDRGWPALMYELLRERRYELLASVVGAAASSSEENLSVLAESTRQQLERAESQGSATLSLSSV